MPHVLEEVRTPIAKKKRNHNSHGRNSPSDRASSRISQLIKDPSINKIVRDKVISPSPVPSPAPTPLGGVKIEVLNEDMRDVINPAEMSPSKNGKRKLKSIETQPVLLNTLSSRQVLRSPELNTLKSPSMRNSKDSSPRGKDRNSFSK